MHQLAQGPTFNCGSPFSHSQTKTGIQCSVVKGNCWCRLWLQRACAACSGRETAGAQVRLPAVGSMRAAVESANLVFRVNLCPAPGLPAPCVSGTTGSPQTAPRALTAYRIHTCSSLVALQASTYITTSPRARLGLTKRLPAIADTWLCSSTAAAERHGVSRGPRSDSSVTSSLGCR